MVLHYQLAEFYHPHPPWTAHGSSFIPYMRHLEPVVKGLQFGECVAEAKYNLRLVNAFSINTTNVDVCHNKIYQVLYHITVSHTSWA